MSEGLAFVAMLVVVGTPFALSEVRRRTRRRRALRAARAMGGPIPPLHARLVLDPSPSRWAERKAATFERLGFVRVGAFRVECATLRGIALVSADGEIHAQVLGGSLHGNVVEVGRSSASGETVSVWTRPEFDALPPWYRAVSMRGAAPERLVARLRAEGLPGEPLRISPEGYVAFAEREHRRMSEWVLTHGPLRAEMIPKLERLTGMAAEPEAAEFLRRAHEGSRAYPRP